MGSREKPASNLNNASNICTMHQINNMHHYLRVEELEEVGDLKVAEAEELREAEDLKAVEAEELESSSIVGSFIN
jgi:hypothetical protein